VSTQAVPQSARPDAHWHDPLVHCWAFGHTVEQLPQWASSLDVSTQLCPHGVWPPKQFSEQVPLVHTSPVVQGEPQPPQFAPSVWVSTHAPEQSVRPDWH
jgi:hypothetical protein